MMEYLKAVWAYLLSAPSKDPVVFWGNVAAVALLLLISPVLAVVGLVVVLIGGYFVFASSSEA